MTRFGVGLGVWFAGCPAPEPAAPEPPPPPPAEPAPAVSTLVPSETGIRVRPEFVGVGRQYQGYMNDADVGAALSTALSACFPDETFLLASYDEATRVGKFALQVDAGSTPCRPQPHGDGYDLSGAAHLTTALAAYRDGLAAKYDVRLASFRVGVTYRSGTNLCTLWATGGHPPDGTRFSACIERLGVACPHDTDEAGVTWIAVTADDRSALRSCFGS